ncbi:MAG: hypothetical protein HZB18_09890 [Chloroflexi bacterium]|nr:hypothetical protein [Chloroflexota bacterium]
MDKTKALQKLLNGTATKKEIEMLKQALANGDISIGGDVNRSVVIIGSGNKVELTAEALGILKPESTSVEPVEGEPPYMGMRFFDTADADLFYGREALTRELAARVAKENFLAIVGASGSGKSSVARAGLIPAWQKENAERGAIHVITPTAYPLESLAASLTRESESVTATSTLMDDMNRDVRSLRLYVRKMLSGSGEPSALLVVDQFEETFTLCKDLVERKAFIENLLALTDEEDSPARVVLTLRADFYHHCAEYEGLRLALEKHQAYIGAMTPDELREAIIAPAEKNGWDFQPGLVDLILGDVGAEPGALPLLSHALLETWKRRQGQILTLQGYADAGGVKKAIAQTAESVYDYLSPAEQTIVRDIFLRLTRLGDYDEGRDTSKRVAMSDLLPLERESISITILLEKLANARLIVKTLKENKIEIEVAHEALIQYWEKLRVWLDEDRDNAKLRESVSDATKEWAKHGKDESLLIHRGGRLEDIETLSQQMRYKFNAVEEAYLSSCVFLRDQEASDRRKMQELTDQLSIFTKKAEQTTEIEKIHAKAAAEQAGLRREILHETQKRDIQLDEMRQQLQRRQELVVKATDAISQALEHSTYSRNTVETKRAIEDLLAAIRGEDEK